MSEKRDRKFVLSEPTLDAGTEDVRCVSFTNKGFDNDSERHPASTEECSDEQKPDSDNKKERSTLPRKTKFFVFLSHFLSAWGDRMWSFGVGLFLIQLSPDSLRLTASFGFTSGGAVLFMGALIGDWVDNTPRLRAARVSLLTQNLLVCACAVVVFFVFYFESDIITIWPDEGLMKLCQAVIIATAILSNLASIAFKIAVERDWIVEICGRDKDLLASMSATLRGIDLTTQILAPVVTGQIMAFTEVYYSAAFIAGWNVVSVVVEYNLIRKVYQEVPALRNKMYKKREDKGKAESRTGDGHAKGSDEATQGTKEASSVAADGHTRKDNARHPDQEAKGKKDCAVGLSRVFDRFITVFRGWRTYVKYDVAFAGFGLSCLYMTVLGFDNITVGYAYSQGISEAILGGLQAGGAIMGILGTLAYPQIRKTVGLERTGLFGLAAEIICLCFCVASVWLPGSPFDLTSSGDIGNKNCPNISATQIPLVNFVPSTSVNSSVTAQIYNMSAIDVTGCDTSATSVEPEMSIWFLMAGIITARFGLWVSDLTITQLFLQTVEETERGIVNGVQNSLNKFMDMLKFLLVIVLPLPNQFGLLVLLSFLFIVLAWVFYAKYSHGARGHLLPKFVKLRQYLDTKNNNIPATPENFNIPTDKELKDVSVHL